MAIDGIKWFENDGAGTWLIEYKENPRYAVENALKEMLEGEDPEFSNVDECQAAIAAAHHIAAAKDGDMTLVSEYPYAHELAPALINHPDLEELAQNAILALERVVDEDLSELAEFMQEQEDDYTAWRQGTMNLIARLKK